MRKRGMTLISGLEVVWATSGAESVAVSVVANAAFNNERTMCLSRVGGAAGCRDRFIIGRFVFF
jgi:hypothetical protein